VLREYELILNAQPLKRQDKIERFKGLFQVVGKKLTSESVSLIRSHILTMDDSETILYEGLCALYQSAAHSLSPTDLVGERDIILTASQLNGDRPIVYVAMDSEEMFVGEPEIIGPLQSGKKCSVLASMYRQSADGLSDTERQHHVTSILQSDYLNPPDKRLVLKSIYDRVCSTWTGYQIATETDFVLGQSGIDESVVAAIYINGEHVLSSEQIHHEINKILNSDFLSFNSKGNLVNRLFPWSVRLVSPERLASESGRVLASTVLPNSTIFICLETLYSAGAADLSGDQLAVEREKILRSNLPSKEKRGAIEALYGSVNPVVLSQSVQNERIAILGSTIDADQPYRTNISMVLLKLYTQTKRHLPPDHIETETNAICNSPLDSFERSGLLDVLKPLEDQSFGEMLLGICSIN